MKAQWYLYTRWILRVSSITKWEILKSVTIRHFYRVYTIHSKPLILISSRKNSHLVFLELLHILTLMLYLSWWGSRLTSLSKLRRRSFFCKQLLIRNTKVITKSDVWGGLGADQEHRLAPVFSAADTNVAYMYFCIFLWSLDVHLT